MDVVNHCRVFAQCRQCDECDRTIEPEQEHRTSGWWVGFKETVMCERCHDNLMDWLGDQ